MNPINVADIVARRAPGRKIPAFIMHYLERLVHQDELNECLTQYGHLRGYEFLDAFLRKGLGCDYTVHEDVPMFGPHGALQQSKRQRPPVFVSNHPLGGLDGMILLLLLHEHGYDAKVIVNDLLMNVEPIKDLMVPVNKLGGQRREYVERMNELWASDVPILTFPSGAVSRLIDGEVKDLPWKDTYIKKAKQYGRDIVPIYFDARNSMHFYRVAQWRKWLRIPFNIEMMLLPDEMFRQRGHHYNVYFYETSYSPCRSSFTQI